MVFFVQLDMNKKQRWYVVFVGRQVGIYQSWVECHAQVNKYAGALYKLYDSYNDAVTVFGMYNARDVGELVRDVPNEIEVHAVADLEDRHEDDPIDNIEQPVVAIGQSGYSRDMCWCIITVVMFILGILLTHIVYSVMGRVG